MAKIYINYQNKRLREYIVNGKFTVSAERVADETGQDQINYRGSFVCHDYIPEIDSLKNDRFSITGIDVIQEVYGSDDYNILYEFVAHNVEVLIEDPISDEQRELIEKKLYPDLSEDIENFLSGVEE